MINLLNLTKEQKDLYWTEYEIAEREFDEACEDWENMLKLEMACEDWSEVARMDLLGY